MLSAGLLIAYQKAGGETGGFSRVRRSLIFWLSTEGGKTEQKQGGVFPVFQGYFKKIMGSETGACITRVH